MKTEHQRIALAGIKTGRYKIEDGCAFVLWNQKWRALGNPLVISNHRRDSGRASITIHLHELEYLMSNGSFPESMKVLPDLTLTPSNEVIDRPYKPNKRLRSPEIASIRKLHSEGKSQSAIARELKLNRLSTRRIIKKIEAGEELKYEYPKSKYDKWKERWKI